MPSFSRLSGYAFIFCVIPALPLVLMLELTNRFDSVGWWYTVLSASTIALPFALFVSGVLTFIARQFPAYGFNVLRFTCACAATAFTLFAVWSLLWMFSSASLACLACDCSYSLFAVEPRCRQPTVALLTCIGSVGAAVWAGVVAIRSKK